MIFHGVFIKLKDDENLEEIVSKSETLRDIEEVKLFHMGINTSSRNGGYQLGISSYFQNKEELNSYINHKLHIKYIKDWLKESIVDAIAIDAEVKENDINFAKTHMLALKVKSDSMQSLIEASKKLDDIESVLKIDVNENFSTDKSRYNLVLTSHFEDDKGLNLYLEHPIHKELVDKFIKPNVEEILVYDN